MLKRYRRAIFAAKLIRLITVFCAFLWKLTKARGLQSIIIIAVTLVGGFTIVRGLVEQSEYEWASNNSSQDYTRDTYSPAYDSCLRLAVSSQANCIEQANNEWRENERKEQDLVAQQTTAVWTFLMGMAAVVGVTLSAVGVYLVWITFRETRNANEIAKLQISLSQKPMIFVTCEGTFVGDKSQILAFKDGENPRLIMPRLKITISNLNEQICFLESLYIGIYESNNIRWCEFFIGDILIKNSPLEICNFAYRASNAWQGNDLMGNEPSIWFTAELRRHLMMNPPPFMGKIIYSDAANATWQHNFAFAPEVLWADGLLRFGGKEFNYEKRQEPEAIHSDRLAGRLSRFL